MIRKLSLTLAILLTIIVIVGLSIFGKFMVPIQSGNVEEFWYFTCHVNIDGVERDYFSWSGFSLIQNEKYIYEAPNWHNSYLYWIPSFTGMTKTSSYRLYEKPIFTIS